MAREKDTTAVTAKMRAPRRVAVKEGMAATPFTQFVDPGKRAALIAEAAYYRAEQRGFAPGNELEDWLAAESEVDARLLKPKSAPRV
jgi:hypothetical protein